MYFLENFTHAQKAETRRSFRHLPPLTMNYEARGHSIQNMAAIVETGLCTCICWAVVFNNLLCSLVYGSYIHVHKVEGTYDVHVPFYTAVPS